MLAAGVAAAACSLVTDLSPLGAKDAAVDAPVEAPSDGFALTASPSHVTGDPKDGYDVSIAIVRGASFTDIVDVTVNDIGGLKNITTNPLTMTFTGTTPVSLHIDIADTAPVPQDGTLTLLGIGRTTQKNATTTVGVRIGSVLLDTMKSTSLTVPPYASSLVIKAWGGGGGAGATTSGFGGTGGGGGLAGGLFSVTPSGTLDVTVGQPGTFAQGGSNGSGGSGGGYTKVMQGATLLVVAGGGGGGAQGGEDTSCVGFNGGNGLAGGGANAQTSQSNKSATTSAPGVAGDSNATAGAQFQGGDGAKPCTGNGCKTLIADGGVPGGGRGGNLSGCLGAAGGGGGGGYWGGGGGGVQSGSIGNGGGGGGGSGFVSDAGADVVQLVGSGPSAAGFTDPDYVQGPGNGGTTQGTVYPANAGRVVIRLIKP